MKAMTITVDEELDARAAAEAKRRGVSTSELYRNGVTGLIAERSQGRQATRARTAHPSDTRP